MLSSHFKTSIEICSRCAVYHSMKSMSGGEMNFCRPSGASVFSRLRSHGLRRGLLSFAPPGLQFFLICLSALGLTVLCLATPTFAFEPMPPIMQKLLEVFPEENGRFVDEPFGSTAEMPDEAKPFFETFRVVVPGPEDLEKNLARLFSASGHLPIRKITRYDKEPGAPGLAGFRGVWCQTEDKDQVGFSIVTINQNRFLIWAKMGYFPAFANDSINPKVRDQYARDVSQYLAGIDMKVPENEAPEARGRGLPEWMGLYYPQIERDYEHLVAIMRCKEIGSWGLRRVTDFTPTGDLLDQIIAEAPQRLLRPRDSIRLQEDLGRVLIDLRKPTALVDSVLWSSSFDFAVDRYGRMRIMETAGEGDLGLTPAVFFAGAQILCAGQFGYVGPHEYFEHGWVTGVSSALAVSEYQFNELVDSASCWQSEAYLHSLGHFLAVARDLGLDIDRVSISKTPW